MSDSPEVKAAVAALYKRLHTKLVRRLVFHSIDVDLAHEAVQEAFVRLVLKWKQLDNRDGLEAWLFRVALNFAYDEIKRRHPWSPLRESIPGPEPRGVPEDALLRQERHARLQSAVRRLHPIFKEVLSLYYEEELTIREIAARLSIPPGTVKSRLYRARMRLAEDGALQRIVGGSGGGYAR